MGFGRDVDDPGRGGGRELVAQQRGEREIRHMVQRKSALEPVRGDLAAPEHGAGVVDQHVDAGERVEARRERAQGIEPRQVGIMHAHLGPGGASLDPGKRRFAARRIAPHQYESRPLGGEALRRDQPDPGSRAGDDAELALHAGHRSSSYWCL